MKLAKARQLEAKHLVQTYDRLPVLLQRGKGAYLYDDSGRRYLDFLSGIGVNALGYAHPAISRVIARQSKQLLHTSNIFYHSYQGELAQRLAKISGLDRVFFSNSGTEAWEGALKFARAYARKVSDEKRWRILAMSDAFHGRTFGSLATTFTKKYREPFTPVLPGVTFVKFNDVAELRANFDDTVCAIAMEPIQGEGGIRPVSQEFLVAARQLTQKTGALLVLDEIQSGMGRTGKYFAFQHYPVQPDIVTIAKPLAAGLPLGAILVREQVASVISPGMHGSTFGGGPLSCAAALEFLNVMEREKLLANVRRVGGHFLKRLQQIDKQSAEVVDVRGVGLMLAMELDSADRAKQVVKDMLDMGVLINRTHETVLRFLPPYIITEKQADEVADKLASLLLDTKGPKGRKKIG